MLVVLVRTNHVVVFIKTGLGIELGPRGPKFCCIQNQLSAFLDHPEVIAGQLPILYGRKSNVCRDMDIDVARPDADQLGALGKIRYPGWRDLFACIGAFPGELCSLKTVQPGFGARPGRFR